MKSGNSYKTNTYYFTLQSMLRNNEVDKRCSKRAKKQIDFVRNFIDSKDAEELKKSVKVVKNGRSI